MTNTNATYNTGRKITIDLDNLSNAEIWQIYQMLTDYTGYLSAADEPDANPSADIDAATEVFLHIAETADERSENADAFQRDWLQGIKDEYNDIFGEEEEQEEEAPTVYQDLAEYTVAVWFEDPRATDKLLRDEAENVKEDPHNLFKAGTFDGLARMTAATIVDAGADRGVSQPELTRAIYERYGVAW